MAAEEQWMLGFSKIGKDESKMGGEPTPFPHDSTKLVWGTRYDDAIEEDRTMTDCQSRLQGLVTRDQVWRRLFFSRYRT